MKGDFSKDTFRKKKHFHDVRMQQGRVLLDTDWNEQGDITAHRIEAGTKDIIGDDGAPIHDAGFKIEVAVGGADLTISRGRFYVDGILCENEEDLLLYTKQADYPQPLPTTAGTYRASLDVWKRHITSVEDPDIREVALGGPDTTTRNKTIWQVILESVDLTITPTPTCLDLVTVPVKGELLARAEKPTETRDPCGLTESGGYRRLENQLYRVEIHKPGNRTAATFKWSRDNGWIVVKWESQDPAKPDNLVVSSTGKDELLDFKPGDWVELTDDTYDLLSKPGVLVKLLNVVEKTLIIDPANIIWPPGSTTTVIKIEDFKLNPKIRRWDSAGELKPNTNNTDWIELEDGVQVQFTATGSFNTGDYWMIPARTATADVEWPKDDLNNPEAQQPMGIEHHFGKLAILQFDGTLWSVILDCRPIFPPVTELTSLLYVSGDGQEAMPGGKLQKPIQVGVANGQWPVEGARIKFELVTPGIGSINPAGVVVTGADGIASCEWTLGPVGSPLSQQVKASLIDALNNPHHLPIIFTANLSVAENVFYQPACDKWTGPAPDTVAKALDALCERESSSRRCCSISVGKGGDIETLKEALEKLQREIFICICLLPGEHEIGESSLGNENTRMIKITGCGAHVFLFGNRFELKAEEVVLEGLNISARVFELDTQIILKAHKLHTEKCSFLGFAKEIYQITPFVLVEALFTESIMTDAEINWGNNNVMIEQQTGTALGFGPRVQGWIKHNRIGGDIMLQYDTKFADLDWTQFLENGQLPNKEAIEGKLPQLLKLFPSGSLMHITGNILGRLRTNANRIMNELQKIIEAGEPMREEQPAFRNLIVTDNVFEREIGSFVAEMFTMSNNQFMNKTPNALVAFAMGFRGMFIGNMDYADSRNNNSSGIIETIFNRKPRRQDLERNNLIEIR